jgi:hypothetical protein
VSGNITADGALALEGSYSALSGGFTQRVQIVSWTTTPTGRNGLSGRFVFEVSVVGSDGHATQTCEIVSAAKTLE